VALVADLPTGLVTLLFTDVEGSTRLLHRLGAQRYAEALAEHRRVIREACAARGGVEVDTQGDAFFFAFTDASAAVAAAGNLTEALAAGPISVRVGVHTGTPHLTEEGYVGDDVHLAARVAASAHGGQVVATRATQALVDGFELVELGEHRLKDIGAPVSIWQLGSAVFPPLKTISNTNLPRPASAFVGRQRELGELLARVRGDRLVTLTGPGGTGKTRLALEAAAELVPEFKAGVFWVGLAALRDPALVGETIAQALGAKNGLAEHVAERELLLLLDNLEQVVEAAPQLADLLEACPNLRLLVTSRELLRVRGEVDYQVPPLEESEAVELFAMRAQLAPSDETRELCRRLDFLPLAVELAAARTRALTPGQILERLSHRLDLLKGGRDADPRQQTLRATIEWSYELLPVEEQQLFRRLAVFVGGCTLEAAEQVCEADLDTLQALVDKSLIRFTDGRYWMLQTIGEYAAERLQEEDQAEDDRRRHAEFMATLAAQAEPALFGSRGQADWLRRLDAERLNVAAAMAWATRADMALALALAGSVWRYWWYRAYLVEGYQHVSAALDVDPASDPQLRLKVLEGASYLAYRRGDTDATRAHCGEALRLARESGDAVAEGVFVNQLSLVANAEGDFDRAEALLGESARLLDGDPYARFPLGNLGLHALRRLDARRATRVFTEVLEMDRSSGDQHHESGVVIWLGLALSLDGRVDEAKACVREGLEIAGELRAEEVVAMGLLVAARLGTADRPESAAAALGSADGILERAGAQRRELVPGTYEHLRSGLQDQLGRDAFLLSYEQGRGLSLPDAVLAGLASLH
jgi:predicted ATPase